MSRASTKENLYLYDGWQNLSGGMDSSRTPDLIDPSNFSLAVNVTVRGGKPRTRPGFKKITVTPREDLGTEFVEGAFYVNNEFFLGGDSYYRTSDRTSYLIANYGGHIVKIDPTQKTAEKLDIPNQVFTSIKTLVADKRTYFCQVEDYVVIQNGIDIPLIFNVVTEEIRWARTGTNNPKKFLFEVTRIGTEAIIRTTTPHGFQVGDYIEIQGTDPEAYEGNHYVTEVVDQFEFKYDLGEDSPTTPATIEDGISYTRFVPEVPTGLFMAFGQGRLFVVSPNRTEFLAGDILYGDVRGTKENALRFTETQYLAEGGSFSLPASMGQITGMSFASIQDTSTGQGPLFVFGDYGIGSFDVSLPRASIVNPQTFQVVVPGWKDAAIQRVALTRMGCSAPESIVSFNGDMLWRSAIGIRTYRNARADQNNYGITPISAEVSRILDKDPREQTYFTSSIFFDNRMLMTCTPIFEERKVKINNVRKQNIVTQFEPTLIENKGYTIDLDQKVNINVGDKIKFYGGDFPDGKEATVIFTNITSYTSPVERIVKNIMVSVDDLIPGATFETAPQTISNFSYITSPVLPAEIYHRGLVALDYTSVSGVGGKADPAWDGVWGGLNFQHLVSGIFKGRETAFAFTYDSYGNNGIWEITRDLNYDDDGSNQIPILCALETSAYSFGMQMSLKQLQGASLWISDIQGEVKVKSFYRPDNFPCWQEWHTFTRCANVSSPLINETSPVILSGMQALPQQRARVDLPTPSDATDPVGSHPLRNFYYTQIRFEWEGNMRIDKFMLFALDKPERINAFI